MSTTTYERALCGNCGRPKLVATPAGFRCDSCGDEQQKPIPPMSDEPIRRGPSRPRREAAAQFSGEAAKFTPSHEQIAALREAADHPFTLMRKPRSLTPHLHDRELVAPLPPIGARVEWDESAARVTRRRFTGVVIAHVPAGHSAAEYATPNALLVAKRWVAYDRPLVECSDRVLRAPRANRLEVIA